MVRFIHCADLHLDTPFKGLSGLDENIAEKLREAPFLSLERIVDIAIEREVDGVIIAGDLWDVRENSLASRLRFNAAMRRLGEKNIPCFYACGNHDPLPKSAESLPLPENVRRFDGGRVQIIPLEKNGLTLAHVYGISFATAAETGNLAAGFRREDTKLPAIAVLHCNIGSTGHEPYAPATMDDLCRAGMDYWALGHVHRFAILRDRHPAVVYPGVSQGRSPRETGAGGCCLVSMDDNGECNVEFCPVDFVRFAEASLDVGNIADWESLIDIVADTARNTAAGNDSRAVILRLTLTGRSVLDSGLRDADQRNQARNEINFRLEDTDPFIRVESIIPETNGDYDLEALASGNDFTAEIIAMSRRITGVESLPESLREEISDVFRRYRGGEMPDHEEWINLNEDALARIMNIVAGGK